MPRKTYDWSAIEADYRAGMPLRELEAKYGANRGTISKKAKAWGKRKATPKRKKATKKKGKGPAKKATRKATKKRQPKKATKADGCQPGKPAQARQERVDPLKVDAHFAQPAKLEETIRVLEGHASAGHNIVALSNEIAARVQARLGDKKAKLSNADLKHLSKALVSAGDALYKGNAVYRKNRGLDDKSKTELSGTLDMRMTPEEWRRGRSEKPL